MLNMEPAQSLRKGKKPLRPLLGSMCQPVYLLLPREARRAVKGKSMLVKRYWILLSLVLFSAGCTKLPDVGGMPLPKLETQGPVTYRDLSAIPDPPSPTPFDTGQAAIQQLSQERGTTQAAADTVRGESFTQPTSAPPKFTFQQ